MTNAVQTREISISKNIALHHIHSQAGSVEKAISEAVMNSVDARANEIRIDIAEDGIHYTIADNGRGFADEQEITECFGTLGFDHNTDKERGKERVYGSFGLGRAQLWSWSRNTWKSGSFRMSVDINNRGLTYDLLSHESHVAGCTLEGEFYDAISLTQVVELRRSLKELTQYIDISIYFNGDMISKPVNKQTWTRKTDDAFFKINESGPLKVYNMGMLVKEFPASRFGVSGVVISRKTLTLNVARNDIMLNRCEVFPKIVEVLKEEARKASDKPNTALSQNDRLSILRQILTSRSADIKLLSKSVVKAVDGRFYSINQICKSFGSVVCVGEHDFSPIGETIIHQKAAMVMSPSYFQSLDFSVEDFVTALYSFKRVRLTLVDYNTLAKELDSPVKVLEEKSLSKKRKVALSALKKINRHVVSIIERERDEEGIYVDNTRSVYLGKLRAHSAWTDGLRSIGYNPDQLVGSLESGFKGFMKVAQNMLHEYSHKQSNTGDHSHDLEFYKRYHDSSMKIHNITEDIRQVFFTYAKELVRAGLVLPKQVARDIPEKAESGLIAELEKRDLLEE